MGPTWYTVSPRISWTSDFRHFLKWDAQGIPILQASYRHTKICRIADAQVCLFLSACCLSVESVSWSVGSTQPEVGANETAVVATNGVNLVAHPVFWIKRIQIPTDVCCIPAQLYPAAYINIKHVIRVTSMTLHDDSIRNFAHAHWLSFQLFSVALNTIECTQLFGRFISAAFNHQQILTTCVK